MTSVITSARRASASSFDLVSDTVGAATGLLSSATLSISALEAKARLLHDGVIANCNAQRVNLVDREIQLATQDHVDMLEDIYRRNFPSKKFDREAAYIEAHKKIAAAVNKGVKGS